MIRFLKKMKYPGSWSLFRSDDRLLLMVFAIIVGICSGLAALILNRGLEAMLTWLHYYRGYWWAIFLPAAGAALSSLFLEKIVNEGAGHGVPEVIYAVSRYGGLLRLRSSFSRLISSCLTIGSGGSAGPEAPVVMSGAAIGSNIAQAFSLNDRQRVALVGCGAAGAIAAIFNAPISGMVFAIEVILGEWSTMNIIPIAIAAVAGTEVSRLLKGNQIAFAHREFNIHFHDILACVGLAILCAVASILLTRALRAMHQVSKGVALPVMGPCRHRWQHGWCYRLFSPLRSRRRLSCYPNGHRRRILGRPGAGRRDRPGQNPGNCPHFGMGGVRRNFCALSGHRCLRGAELSTGSWQRYGLRSFGSMKAVLLYWVWPASSAASCRRR
jgi:hypothetical protein